MEKDDLVSAALMSFILRLTGLRNRVNSLVIFFRGSRAPSMLDSKLEGFFIALMALRKSTDQGNTLVYHRGM